MFTMLPFFRVAPRYITQFGPKFDSKVHYRNIKDDPSLVGKRDMDFGNVFFAGSGKDSRDDQMVIALCDEQGCTATGLGHAFWEVTLGTIRPEGWHVLEAIGASGMPYPKLEMPGMVPGASGPDQSRLRREENYLREHYPNMEYFKSCRIVQRDVQLKIPRPRDVLARKGKRRIHMDVSNLNDGQTGSIVFDLLPEATPRGVARLKELIEANFFDEAAFFRVGENFVAQFGMHADPNVNSQWRKMKIPDDPKSSVSNLAGTMSFAHSGPNSRTTQLFINLVDNSFLDEQGFSPVAQLVSGWEYVKAIYAGYGAEEGNGDGTDGKGPRQARIAKQGNAYLNAHFPKLSRITSIRFE